MSKVSKSIYSAERSYSKALQDLPEKLKKTLIKITRLGKLSLNGKTVSAAIILRMRGYYLSQHAVKKLLGKRYIGAASDVFVESVLFYLQVLNASHKLGFNIHSEKQIQRKKSALRPDISVWKEDKVIAMIECKTQLGWNRNNWEKDYLKRKRELNKIYPNAKSFLLVMTPVNWGGFGRHRKLGGEYFVLSKEWPDKVSQNAVERAVLTPIERLFKQIVKVGYRKRGKWKN